MPRCARLAARSSRRFVGLALVASALTGFAPRRLEASPILARLTYQTSGTIDPAGQTGVPAVRFVPGGGRADATAPVTLGSFVVSPPGDGSATRYDHTPLAISFWTRAVDDATMAGHDGTLAAPVVIRGWLSGTVGGGMPTDLSVAFDQGPQPADPRYNFPQQLPLPAFPAGSGSADGGIGSVGTVSVLGGESIFRQRLSDGSNAIAGQLTLAAGVPEPASGLIFGALGGITILTRRRGWAERPGGRS